MDRRDRALAYVNLSGRGLEIGPSYSPLVPKSGGGRIETVDHADRDTLVAKYTEWGLPADKIAAIEPVDHIWGGGSLLDVITDHGRYDYIVASHFLEHTVDMIAFLRDCEALLTDNGRLALVLPDKRYCFDRFQPLSTVGDVIDAADSGNAFHSAGTLLDHQAYACSRAGDIAWTTTSTGALSAQFPTLEGAAQAIADGRAQDEYHDIHHWKLTPRSFELLMHDLAALDLHHLGPIGSYPTTGFEFFITLGKGVAWPQLDRCAELLRIEAELAEPALADGTITQRHPGSVNPELDAVLNSTSWRVTAPLRRVSDAARKWRRGSDAVRRLRRR